MNNKIFFRCCTILILLASTAFEVSGQRPFITSFTPDNGAVGTEVTITGTNFNAAVENNVVYFGAVHGVVTSVSAGLLKVTVPAGGTYQPIAVLNLATGLTGYSSKPLIITFNNPSGTGIPGNFYQPRVDIPLKNGSKFAAIGDLDGDGKPDIVCVETDSLYVLRNISGAGDITPSSFTPGTNLGFGSTARYIVISDLDGDGKQDIITANGNSPGTITVIRNSSVTGSITASSFDSKVDFPTGLIPVTIAAGDLDGDGKPDLAVANYNANSISVLRNTSSQGSINGSSFAARVDYPTGNNSNPYAVAIADMDGDGKADILITKPYFDDAPPTPSVMLYRNESSPGTIDVSSFTIAGSAGTGSAPYSMAIGDLDFDGKPDLVTGNHSGNSVSVIKNTSVAGTFSFSSRIDLPTDNSPITVALGDLDGDGKADIVTANDLNQTLSVFRNISTAGSLNVSSFNIKKDFGTSSFPYSVAVGDLNSDGYPELISANFLGNNLSVLQVNTTALPVRFFNVSATAVQNKVKVDWQTQRESNTGHFLVERSADGIKFSELASVAAAGFDQPINTYSVVDRVPLAGINFYRIKVVDKNDAFSYSTVMKVAISISQAQVTIYPNPVTSRATIILPTAVTTGITFRLLDSKGSVIMNKRTPVTPINNSFSVDVSTLRKGLYTMILVWDKICEKVKFVKK